MKTRFLALFVIFSGLWITQNLLAQTSGFCWVEKAGGSGNDFGGGVATMQSGGQLAILVTGSVDDDIFIASYDEGGNLNWSKQVGSSGSDAGSAIYVDDSDIFVTGRFQNSITFASTPADITLTSDGSEDDIFVARLNEDGDVIWAKRAGGSSSDGGRGIIVSLDFEVFVTGVFQGDASFGETGNDTTLTSAGGLDIFVAKFAASNGRLDWAKRAGGPENDRGLDITVDDNFNNINCFVTGDFNDDAVFGEGEANETKLNTIGSRDMFVAKFNSSGNLVWVEQAGGTETDRGLGIAKYFRDNADDNIYVIGRFEGSVSFGNSINLLSAGGKDVFLAKYDDDGNVIWARSAGGSGDDEGLGVTAIRLAGEQGPIQDVTIQITGLFRGSATFGKNEPNEAILNSKGGADIFAAKYHESGRLLWAKQAGSGNNNDDAGNEIAVAEINFTDDNGDDSSFLNTFVTGSFTGTADFGSDSETSSGRTDLFVTRIEDFAIPRNLNVSRTYDDEVNKLGLASYLALSWDPPFNVAAPTISNPNFANTGNSCSLAGRIFNIEIDYIDVNGVVSSSVKINVTNSPAPSGALLSLVPGSVNVKASSIEFDACILFRLEEVVSVSLCINDDAGNLSNIVSFDIANPDISTSNTSVTQKSRVANSIFQQDAPGRCGGSVNLLSYNIYRVNSSGEEKLIANVPAKTLIFRDEFTIAGQNFLYKVTAVYEEGESEHTGDDGKAGRPSPDKFFNLVVDDAVVNDGGNTASSSWADYDNDGWLDLFVANFSGEDNFLYRNNGNETFTRLTAAEVGKIVDDKGISFSGSWADYNNDTWVDLFVVNFGEPNFLYKNENGQFEKITEGEIVTLSQFSTSASWGDFNDDGSLDLFVANSINQNNELYQNDGSPNYTFTRIQQGDIVNDGGSSNGAAWADYNNDGYLDLFVANRGKNFLYRNDGPPNYSFTKIQSGDIVNDDSQSHGASWGDYDNDGDLDLFVANDKAPNFLYKNLLKETGTANFQKASSAEVGEVVTDNRNSYGSSWGDFDNDGDLDLFVTNRDNNHLYENRLNEGGKLEKVSDGNNVDNNVGNSNGCSWADFNGDGFLDLYVANTFTRDNKNYLYVNNKKRGTNDNNWINIKCVGTTSNWSAIGAKVKVKATITMGGGVHLADAGNKRSDRWRLGRTE